MIFKQLKYMGVLVLTGLALSVVYNIVAPQGRAAALHGSVIISTGEWTSSGGASGMAIPTSVNTASEFKTFINNLLHNKAANGDPGSDYNKYGAAFLVENMIHGKKEFSANGALVTAALNDYDTWAQYVDDYASAGKVQWAVSRAVPKGNFNSTHTCIEGSGGYCWARATYFNNNYNGGGYDAKHFDFYTLDEAEDSTLIIFTNADGTTFQIRRECGNVIGSAEPLGPLGWNLSGRTTVDKTTMYTGEVAKFTSQLRNTGASTANTKWTVQYCYNACASYANYTSGTDGAVAKGGAWKTENTWAYTAAGTNTKICARIAYTNGAGPGTATEYATPVCVTIIALQSNCGGATVSPSLLGTTDSYTISATVNTNGSTTGSTIVDDSSNFYMNVSGPGVAYNNSDVTPVSVGAGTLSVTLSQPPTNNEGTYTITYGITGTVAAVNCSRTFDVALRPYMSVQGGDVVAGTGFGTSCNNTAGIKSWNRGASNGYYGAGSEIAAWATSNITDFVSGTGLSTGVGQGYGLSFANTSNIGGSGYGGNFGTGAIPCMYDYYNNPPASYSTGMPNQTLTSLAGVGSGSYNPGVDGSKNYTVYTGNPAVDLVVGQEGAANKGKQISVYISGNLIIKSNIKYQTYSTPYQIPRINFYVRGSIFIDPNVTELHGVYIAQKNGSDSTSGFVTTCASGASTSTLPYAACNKQLRFVGAVAAQQSIRMSRTYGNLATAPGVSDQPAEIFQYSPEMWMSQPILNAPKYQSYTSLAPIL